MSTTLTFVLGATTIAACWWIERYGLLAAKDVARVLRKGWRQ
jgi:hypothetical protein